MTPVLVSTKHQWKVLGRGTNNPTFVLAYMPFKMDPVPKDVKTLVERLEKEEILDLFVKFCDLETLPAVAFGRVVKAYTAMKAQKTHDEVMKQPHVKGKQRFGV